MEVLPFPYESQDSNRSTLLYFVVSSLDVLGQLDEIMPDKSEAIEFLYNLQVLPPKERGQCPRSLHSTLSSKASAV